MKVEDLFDTSACTGGACYFSPYAHTALIRKREFEPDFIKDVAILAKDKVVQVTFKDGTSEKAVCSDEDSFSLEVGITICLAKKILGGTGKYNSIIRKALKILENKRKSEERDREEKNRILKKAQKKKEYLERREQKRREEKIKIQEEAYYRAMKRIEREEGALK